MMSFTRLARVVVQHLRTRKVKSVFLAMVLTIQPVLPIANGVPGGTTYSGDTRSVPIFAIRQEGGQQPSQVIASGFLYSSRIVFTAGVQEKFFDQAKGGIYVGKPGSRTTEKSGRVKVIKAFYPNSGNAELNDFVVYVLENDLAAVEPYPLLQTGQESSVREASVRGYGEYLNRCGPGAQGPCPEKPTSEVSRQINVNVIPLSQAENFVGYERPQLSGQIILQNARNAQDGVVCRGDTGSPVIGNLGGTGIYLGAASRSMNAKVCGAVAVEKVDRNKPKVNVSFDGISGITHIAPVHRFLSIIDEARNYAAQTDKSTVEKQAETNVLCPDLVFVGARGSGEPTPHQDKAASAAEPGWKADPTRNSSLYSEKLLPKIWLGGTLGALFEKIKLEGGYTQFDPEVSTQNRKTITWLSYGVINASTQYVAKGTPTTKGLSDYLGELAIANNSLLKTTVLEYTSKCPNTQFVIAGYSQGAAIVRLSLEKLSPKNDLKFLQNIQSVILVADPLMTSSDLRLAIDSDKRWSIQQDACGLARLFVSSSGCLSIINRTLLKALEGFLGLATCAINVVKKDSDCSSVGILILRGAVKSPKSTSDLSKITGIGSKKIISVCYNGDLVCAPFGNGSTMQDKILSTKIALAVSLGTEIHTTFYKFEYVQDAMSKWVLRNFK